MRGLARGSERRRRRNTGKGEAPPPTAMQLLLNELNLYGTCVVFAPFWDSRRNEASGYTYDVNGTSEYLALKNNAVFDGTDKAITLDGTDDYAITNAPHNSTGIVGLYVAMLIERSGGETHNIGYWSTTGATNRMWWIGYSGHNDFGIYNSAGTLVPAATADTAADVLIQGRWNSTDAITRANETDCEAAAVNSIKAADSKLLLSHPTTNEFVGKCHLYVAFCGMSIANADAIWARRAAIYALVKAAFPGVGLP